MNTVVATGLLKPNDWSYAIYQNEIKTNTTPTITKPYIRKCNEAQKRTHNAHTIEIVRYYHHYGQLSYKILFLLSLFHSLTRKCKCSLLVLCLSVCITLTKMQGGTKPEKRFTETWHDPIFCCCLLLLLFSISHTQGCFMLCIFYIHFSQEKYTLI